MAKQIVVQTFEWCDIHLKDKQANVEAGFSKTFTVEKLHRTLALCPDCQQEARTLQEWIEALEHYGTKPESEIGHRPAQTALPLNRRRDHLDNEPCPIPGCTSGPGGTPAVYQSRSGLRGHLKEVHGTTLAELLGRKPREDNYHGPYVCDELADGKPCGYESERPQGLGVHKRREHGVLGTSHAAVAARAARTAQAS